MDEFGKLGKFTPVPVFGGDEQTCVVPLDGFHRRCVQFGQSFCREYRVRRPEFPATVAEK